jgi:cell division septum initiation protein DivIVA
VQTINSFAILGEDNTKLEEEIENMKASLAEKKTSLYCWEFLGLPGN